MTTAPTDGQMTVVEHLAELRRRIILSAIAVVLGAVVVFMLYDPLLNLLEGPYRDATRSARFPEGQDLVITGIQEGFLVRLKVATYGGIALALPFVTFQIWRFVTPALHRRERRFALPFLLASILLFGLGVVVAWLTFPKAIDFLLSISGESVQPLITAGNYLSLITLMFIAFGAAFEFPLVIVALLLARVISTAQLRRVRRWAIIGITVFAAVITPSQDPYSLLLMAIPMYLFYEASILIGRLMKR